jgi:VanZ family protein
MPPPLSRRVSLWLPPLAYMIFIYYLSAQSNPVPQVTAVVWDKLLHLVEYSALGLLIARALLGEGRTVPVTVAVAIIITSAYGATDEWHQSFVPERQSDVRDWIVDSAGAAAGAGIAAGAPRWRQRPNKV